MKEWNFLIFRISQKYYYYWRSIKDLLETDQRPIGDPSETNQRPIGDQHSWVETQSETLRCFIRHPSETNMPEWRPNRRPWDASSETHRRPTCLSGDPIRDLEMLHQRPIGDPLKTHRRPTCLTGDWHALLESLHYSNTNKQKVYKISILKRCVWTLFGLRRHVGLQ